MKRIVSIFFLSAALLVLTALSLVPHHHHRAVMCTVMELCEADHAYNDRHTTHDTTGEDAGEEGCVVHASYTRADAPVSIAAPDALPVPIVGHAVSLSAPAPETSGLTTEYGLYIIAYRSVLPTPGGGLRAPPCLS